jgi:hypothetical protein
VAATIAIGLFFAPHKPKPAAAIAPSPSISDQGLLLQVERVVQSGSPASLQPAGLMIPEMAQYKPVVQNKEKHEN